MELLQSPQLHGWHSTRTTRFPSYPLSDRSLSLFHRRGSRSHLGLAIGPGTNIPTADHILALRIWAPSVLNSWGITLCNLRSQTLVPCNAGLCSQLCSHVELAWWHSHSPVWCGKMILAHTFILPYVEDDSVSVSWYVLNITLVTWTYWRYKHWEKTVPPI